ncbi:MAG TPA: heavy metal-binding domain-containing protein [Candidatus Binatia bacterium]
MHLQGRCKTNHHGRRTVRLSSYQKLRVVRGGGVCSHYRGQPVCSEKARKNMHRLMFEHASQLGAKAIITARYDTTEIAAGVTGILASEQPSKSRFFLRDRDKMAAGND